MGKRRSVYMETTRIAATRTAGEITECLIDAGAHAITQEFERDGSGKLSGVSFVLDVAGLDVPFRLPVKVDAMFRTLTSQRAPQNRARLAEADLEQAERVAWRQILRWVEAQVALIATEMVTALEVFLPYIRGNDGRTLFEVIQSKGLVKALPMLAARPRKE